MFDFISSIGIAIPVLIFMSWIVSVASDKLGDVLHILGIKLRIPTTVRGATFDAISSSFPEFVTAMIAVLVYKEFADVGVPTIAGSGVFNILLIPMASILAFKGKTLTLSVEKKHIYRDMIFYSLSIIILAVFVMLGQFTVLTGLILVALYVGYIVYLNKEVKIHRIKLSEDEIRKEESEDDEEEVVDENISYTKIIVTMVIAIAFIWVSIDAIIASASVVADFLNIPKFITSVIIIAAATSIPDTLISVKSARKGDADGAISNAVGSNIFDICIGLGIPMIVAGSAIPVSASTNAGVLVFLVISMLLTAFILLKKSGVRKSDAYIMFAGYVGFLIYIIGVAIGKWH